MAIGGETGTGGIGAVFAPAGEPEYDHAGQESQDQLRHNGHGKIANAVTALSFEYDPVHGMADNSGQEHDEGVDHALYQGIFGTAVEFGAERTELVFPSDWLQRPLALANPDIRVEAQGNRVATEPSIRPLRTRMKIPKNPARAPPAQPIEG